MRSHCSALEVWQTTNMGHHMTWHLQHHSASATSETGAVADTDEMRKGASTRWPPLLLLNLYTCGQWNCRSIRACWNFCVSELEVNQEHIIITGEVKSKISFQCLLVSVQRGNAASVMGTTFTSAGILWYNNNNNLGVNFFYWIVCFSTLSFHLLLHCVKSCHFS